MKISKNALNNSKSLHGKLSLFLPLVLSFLLIGSCVRETQNSESHDTTGESLEPTQTVDKGQDYIDSFIFFGESTTYHLKSRGVLSGGTETKQVWAPQNGTVNLDANIGTLKIVYPETGELLTVSEAVSRKRPERILLCFGLNGAVTKIRRGETYFANCYLELINAVRSASPNTEIILASCFPISKNMDVSAYTVDAQALNEYVSRINGWTRSLAKSQGLKYADIASPLKEDGFLSPQYDSGDGCHLNTAAYLKVIEYLRTENFL